MSLFDHPIENEIRQESLGTGAFLLGNFARAAEKELLAGLAQVTQQSPFRNMITPSGRRMSVAMTNCGELGWVSDKAGYRYASIDPQSRLRWPSMPESFLQLAVEAAQAAGFADFRPDVCLINRYEVGAKLSLHQDKDEQDFGQPIVSVSLGLPAVFLLGGAKRTDKTRRIQLLHGDVVVWGGASRLRYHGILPLKPGHHELLGDHRINLTFRKAG